VTPRILTFIDSSYWAMDLSAFCTFREVITRWAQTLGAPAPFSTEEKHAAIVLSQSAHADALAARADTSLSAPAPKSIALLSIFGTITPRAGMVGDLSEMGCTMDRFARQYQAAMTDGNIAGVIVQIDSPGGNVYQVPETADLIYSLRDRKPNVGVVTGMCASAAFWLGAQFSELVATQSSELGSIGVLMKHEDVSKAAEEAGVKVTFITSPRDGNKAEGNPFTPLSDDSIAYYNSRTDAYYTMFLSALKKGRGAHGNKDIGKAWGAGRMVGAAQAVELGMADRIGTMQGEVERMTGKAGGQGNGNGSGGRRAEIGDRERITAAQARLRLA
jgi:signal peptide peptidase SppA